MINNIVIYVDQNLPFSSFIEDKKRYKELLETKASYDFETNQISFISNKKLKHRDNDTGAEQIIIRFNDRDIFFKRSKERKLTIDAWVVKDGKKYPATDKEIRIGHSLEKMFLGGEFNLVFENELKMNSTEALKISNGPESKLKDNGETYAILERDLRVMSSKEICNMICEIYDVEPSRVKFGLSPELANNGGRTQRFIIRRREISEGMWEFSVIAEITPRGTITIRTGNGDLIFELSKFFKYSLEVNRERHK